jgi:predicted lipoprotein with Yx(FWY)xxD motif
VRALIGAALLILLLGSATTSAASGPTAKTASSDALGAKVIVDGAGRTLYRFTLDRGKSIKCTGTCARVWPPVIVPRGTKPVAGKGVAPARLGTVARADGRLQLTYYGLPLYRYAQDKRAGDVTGQGLGGNWFAVGPSGRLVKAVPAAVAPAPGDSTTPTPTTPTPADPPSYGY